MTTRAELQHLMETAEAVCGALHNLGYEFLGETGDAPYLSTWWARGQTPKRVRVEVVRSALAPMVLINTEFHNFEGKIGRVTAQIDVRGAKVAVMEATEKAILRQLEIFRDTLEGVGVAGPQAAVERVATTTDSTLDSIGEDDESDES